MTRQRQYGEEHPMSTWLRNNSRLDSRTEYLSIQDVDFWVHKYRDVKDAVSERLVNHIMMVEVKVLNGEPNFAQRDTLSAINQVAAKRGHRGIRAIPFINERGQKCDLYFWGAHLLQLSGWCPDSSELIRWDGKTIDVQTLEELLCFARHPTTLSPDMNRRHHAWKQSTFWTWTNGGIHLETGRGTKLRS